MMSKIKNKNTKPELIVRKILWKLGFRYRLHRKDLPGKPDIVIGKFKKAIFINGCFWHRHDNCKYAYMPKSRKTFWENKFKDNLQRDLKVKSEYLKNDYERLVIWECETRNKEKLEEKLILILNLME